MNFLTTIHFSEKNNFRIYLKLKNFSLSLIIKLNKNNF